MTNDQHIENKQTVRRLYEEALSGGQSELFEMLVSNDYVNPVGARGPRAFAAVSKDLHAAFPDIRYQIDDLVTDGDRVIVRWTWKGTHKGPFRQFGPTNREVTNAGIAIHHVKEGKVGKTWLLTDRLGFLDQLGVLPPGLIAPTPPRAQ